MGVRKQFGSLLEVDQTITKMIDNQELIIEIPREDEPINQDNEKYNATFEVDPQKVYIKNAESFSFRIEVKRK